MDTATVFVLSENTDLGILDKLGVRYGSAMLPAGAVVVAFMVAMPSGVEVLRHPAFYLPDPTGHWPDYIHPDSADKADLELIIAKAEEILRDPTMSPGTGYG